jgi:dTDP-glucose pyrophosphorylase/CBS domain-containing protein
VTLTEKLTASYLSRKSWRKTLLPLGVSLREVIHNLNETNLQIVLIVKNDDILVGTLTDGDVRRGLLRGLGMDSPIDEVVFRDPLVLTPEVSREMALQLMKVNEISAIPIVDEDRHVMGLYLLKEILAPAQRSNQMVVMVGGQGSRLQPHTRNCPKPMLLLNGKPMLEHIVERAKVDGFRRFVLAVKYLGHMIEDYFDDGSKWGVEIDYLREESPLGTAGALGLLDPRPDAPIIVTNGDVLTDIRYGEVLDFHCNHKAMGTMAVRLYEWQHPFGVVHIKGVDIVGFEEKPIAQTHINAGVYVLEPKALDTLNTRDHCDMPMLFERLQEKKERTIVYPIHEPWLDVGRADDLKQAREEMDR